MTLRDAKRALRDTLLQARDKLDPQFRADASRAIAARITALDSYRIARVVLLTLPYRSEWDAALLAQHAIAAGKTVAVPRVDTAARMLRPLRIADLQRDVDVGYRGIPEPRADRDPVAPEAIEWVLVPGVAFDPRGARLGYGGGFYDRLLPLLPRAAQRVAGAFDMQLAAAVPTAPHDLRVDWIATESRALDCTNADGDRRAVE
jgi:5-formyltetrahydrofolate cyclo-ligase